MASDPAAAAMRRRAQPGVAGAGRCDCGARLRPLGLRPPPHAESGRSEARVKAAWQRQELAWTNHWQLQEELNALTCTDSSGRS